jgi:hypothetical protein
MTETKSLIKSPILDERTGGMTPERTDSEFLDIIASAIIIRARNQKIDITGELLSIKYFFRGD